jgi:hypothetical protein
MVVEMSLGSETHLTVRDFTFERFEPFVAFLVSQKVSFLSEALFTTFKLANERFLAGMQPLMDLKPSCPRISLPTLFPIADKRLLS